MRDPRTGSMPDSLADAVGDELVDAMAGSLAESRGASGPCPGEDELVQMIEGALDAEALEALEEHIDACDDCAAVVGELGAGGAPPKPRQVGRYLLDRRIGGGGMGEVWAAWDPKLRREIAVKLVRPDRADDGRERERLLREARALARLGHPNVIAVHDVGEAGAEVFIATELVAGETLASRGGASADWRGLVRLYAQAARGLAAAHAVGLVHRDVKPANLLVGQDGRVRVADFGLAVRTAPSARPSPLAPTETPSMGGGSGSITEAGAIAGTPAYMAPEQRTGNAVDAPADQFALCVALGEAIAGRRPPYFVDHAKLIAFVAERRPHEDELDELCEVIARGLAIEPADRFPDMTALADALDAIVPPIVAAPPAARDRSARGATAAPSDRGPGAAATGPSVDRDPASERSTAARVRSTMPFVALALVAAAAGAIAVWVAGRDPGRADGGRASAPLTGPGSDGVGSAGEPTLVAVADAGLPAVDAASTDPAPPVHDAAPDRPGVTQVRPRPHRPQPSPTVGPPTNPPTNPPTGASGGASIATVSAAIKRRDGRACRAELAALTSPPPTDFRVANLHAICEMVAGNCAGGVAEQRALYRRDGTPESAADISADLYCPLTSDPVVRLRRLSKQISMYTKFDCDHFIAAARTSAAAATTDRDRQIVGSILSRIATCYSHRGQCDVAKQVLAEAQVFIPALATNELNAQCR